MMKLALMRRTLVVLKLHARLEVKRKETRRRSESDPHVVQKSLNRIQRMRDQCQMGLIPLAIKKRVTINHSHLGRRFSVRLRQKLLRLLKRWLAVKLIMRRNNQQSRPSRVLAQELFPEAWSKGSAKRKFLRLRTQGRPPTQLRQRQLAFFFKLKTWPPELFLTTGKILHLNLKK